MKTKLLKGIAGKIAVGYAIIIGVTLVISFSTFFIVKNLRNTDRELSESIIQSFISLKEFKNLNSISYKLTSNWIYLPSQQDKESLKTLFDSDYPMLANKFNTIVHASKSKNDKATALLRKMEEIIRLEKEVTKKLSVDSLYSNDVAVDEAISLLSGKVKPAVDEFNKDVDELIGLQQKALIEADEKKASSYSILTITVVVSTLIYAIVGVIASLVSVKAIVNPINALKEIVLNLSQGKINELTIKTKHDEVGEMVGAIGKLIEGIKSNTSFAIQIGEGNYNSSFQPLSKEDQMGNALLQMRSNLKRSAEEDAKRNWATAGLAEIGEILRKTNQSSVTLYDQIILFLVKYLKANQGGLFILEDTNPEDLHLTMVACYAYNRKKFINQRIDLGQGLVGQCYLEKEIIYMTKVPEDYVRITSGLGEGTPGCVLIVPLKVNEEIQGVAEIAAFKPFEKHEIDFVAKLAESIASSITTVKVNTRTQLLLHSSQQQAEELKAQEEEMRQNVEELSATQEEISRRQLDNENVVKAIDSSFAVVEFEPTGVILNANQNFAALMGYSISEMKGRHHRLFVDPDERQNEEYLQFWNNLANGVEKKGKFKRINKHGEPIWINGNYTPMRDNMGKVVTIMKIAFDITGVTQKEATYLKQISELEGKLGLNREDETKRVVGQLADSKSILQHGKINYSVSKETSKESEKDNLGVK
jgi:PAS domain S-box-containing protein